MAAKIVVVVHTVTLILLSAESILSQLKHSLKTDTSALLSFKKTIQRDPNGALSNWNIKKDPCTWPGITCNLRRVSAVDLAQADLVGAISFSQFSSLGMLTSLNLSANSFTVNATVSLVQLPCSVKRLELSFSGLTGRIPENFFANCPDLEYVNLAFNNITGPLPENLFRRLEKLRYLDLSYNNISGPISGLKFESCAWLWHLDWSSNQITGSLPASFANCTGLTELILPENSLSGEIPSSFGSLKSLQRLDLSQNHLSGWIPYQLGDACGSLLELKLSKNNLTGQIPGSLSSCMSLETLDLSSNNLTGPFPDNILPGLSSLESLLLSSNRISGEFPSSVSFCKRLRVVDFSSNFLSGIIPTDICRGNISSLEVLAVPDNSLSGQIPPELSKCSRLKIIDFSLNYINGSIPGELGNLENLEQIIAWYNSLEGSVPAELGKCKKLKSLILNNNNLSGEIPIELFDCTDIEWISLTSNRVGGEIPREFGSLTRLAVLQLGNNSFTGEIPKELANCASLVWIDLSNNELSGEIPPRLGRQMGSKAMTGILSGNTMVFVRNLGSSCTGIGGLLEFFGIRPERLLQVPSLRTCDFTLMYSGPVLSHFTRYQTLEYLDLSYNNLRGKIPDTFGNMMALQVLVLAHNRLSGEIPVSLGQLKNLGVFDGSHNRLQGHIPDSFSMLSFLVQIDLSYNELTGEIPPRGQLSTLPATQYAHNPGLCGVPLPTCQYNQSTQSNDENGEKWGQKDVGTSWANSTIMGILISIVSICMLIVWAIVIRARRKQVDEDKMIGSLQSCHAATTWNIEKEKEPLSINVATFQSRLTKLKFSQLIEATNGFSAASMIGSGGFGEVFKATLKDGSSVAIKKLIRLSCQGDREFMSEMETLGKIKHKNLVPLLGYCKVGEERLLVYEFMEYGSLDEMLHCKPRSTEKATLTWEERKKIARGAARGLCFLHHNCIPHIIHRDMKSSNVLLDNEMEARLSDFGMARLISALDTHLSVSTLAGTPGYVPPEYYQSFRCTTKGDVYSFGVIMLELLTGRRPTDKEDFGDTNLVGWVKGRAREGRGMEVIDREMVGVREGSDDEDVKEMVRYLEMTLRCVDDFPSRRPSMVQVAAMLRELDARGSSSNSS